MNGKKSFLYLNEQDMIKAGVGDMHKCIDTMSRAFKTLSSGDYRMGGAYANSHGLLMNFPKTTKFPNMPTAGPDRRFTVMPAYLGGEFNISGVKWYGSNKENQKCGLPRSILTVMLNDTDTGLPISFMSANILSSMRTAAVSGVGAKYLARKDARICGIIGPGVIGRTSLLAILDSCPGIDTVKIYGRRMVTSKSLEEYILKNIPQIKKIYCVEEMKAAAEECDVICLAASGNTPYIRIEEKWLKPGALVCLPAEVDFDEDFMLNHAVLISDDWLSYVDWLSELGYPAAASNGILGFKWLDMVIDGKMNAEEKITDIGEIISGKKQGRTSEKDIILFSITGLAIEDVAWGYEIYKNAAAAGIGTELTLWNKPYIY